MALTAFSKDNALNTLNRNYVDGLAAIPDDWRQIVDFTQEQSGALRVTSMASIGEVASWNGTADLNDTAVAAGSAGTKTIDIAQFGAQVTISRLNAQTIPGLVDGMARRMGVAVANTYRKQVFTRLNQCAGSQLSGDGKAFFATDHTVPGGSGTRSNSITSALDPAGIAAAIAAIRGWVDSTGAPYDLSGGGFWLVVPYQLEEAARSAVASPYTLTTVATPAEGGSPSQGLSNMVTQFISQADIIVANTGIIGDTNAWYLLPKLANPLLAWERLSPVMRQVENSDDLSIRLTTDFALAVACNVEPAGIFSNPS